MGLFKKNYDVEYKNQEIQTIPVRDLKEYLVQDFKKIESNEIEIKRLKGEVEELEKTEIKYKATLITLEEFDTRIKRADKNYQELEAKLNSKNKEIKMLNEKVNNCTIRERQALDKINNVKKTILVEFIDEFKEEISNTKGLLSKKIIIDMLDKGLKNI